MKRKGKAMSKKKDKPEEAPPLTPWACEIEFLNKPSFMTAAKEFIITNEQVTIVKDDETTLTFPYESVTKVLIMHTKPQDEQV